MNGDGQSDRFVVPANPLNKAAAAEAGEERERAKGNTGSETRPGRSAGLSVSSELDRVATLRDLHERVQQGRYRASPSRRAYIPKADGRLRPLGIATLEDKIVQRAVAGVLNAVYEVDFLGFSYGFRPGRG